MQPDLKIWLDNHISFIMAKWLQDDFEDTCQSSFILKLHGLDDIDIYKKAKATGYLMLLTKDSHFPSLVERLGSPHKIINIIADIMKSRVLYSHLKINMQRWIRL